MTHATTPHAGQRRYQLHIPLTEAERATLSAYAARTGRPLTVLVRERMLRVARAKR